MHKPLFLSLLALMFATPLLAANDLEFRMLRTLNLAETPRQIASTADGQRIYVLAETGEISLYSSNGDLVGTFYAGPDVNGIAPQGNNRLILQMAEQKKMMLVALEPVVQIPIADSPLMGDPDAPVSITVFDDFECPYCAKAVPLLKQVVTAYQDKVNLVYKHFPLGMHKNARSAAIASMAAQEQGKFWPYHDLLFANYNKLSDKKLTALAEEAGLDMARFVRDLKDPRFQQRLQTEQQLGRKIGVRGTPTIFVNGRLLPQRSRAAFDQLISAELAKLEQTK